MNQKESGLRTQLSFLGSLFLHAGAVAIIALGPTFLVMHGFNGTVHNKNDVAKNTPVDVTIAQPVAPVIIHPVARPVVHLSPAPAVIVAKKSPPVIVKKSPVVVPVAQKVVAQKVIEQKSVPVVAQKPVVQPTVAKTSKQITEPSVAKAMPAPAAPPVTTSAVAKPQPAASASTVAQSQPSAAASAGSPKSIIKVTQNYLLLRQMPGNQPPIYTRDMRLQNMQGTGQLVYFVNKEGAVSDMHLTKSTGYPELDQAAVQAFSKYRFYPGQAGYTVHNFKFVLNGPAISDAPGLRTTMSGN